MQFLCKKAPIWGFFVRFCVNKVGFLAIAFEELCGEGIGSVNECNER